MILDFPQKPRIIISRAYIATETEGERTIRHDPPQPRFFLEYEDGEGRCLVWDGPTHLDALEAANDWLADGIEVRDRTYEQWGRA